MDSTKATAPILHDAEEDWEVIVLDDDFIDPFELPEEGDHLHTTEAEGQSR